MLQKTSSLNNMIRNILHFRFDIPYTDDPEDSKLEIIVQLSQKDARSTLLSDQRQNLVIGFHVMKVEANRRYRVHKVIK